MDFYLLLVKLSDPRKFILASDGVGTSTQLLNVLDSAQDLNKIGIATLSSYSEPGTYDGLARYISGRLEQATSGDNSTLMDKLLNEYIHKCKQIHLCKVKDILKNLDSTKQMIMAVGVLLNAFKYTHRAVCGEGDDGLCEGLMDSRLLYSTIMRNLQLHSHIFEVDGVQTEVTFDDNGDLSSSTPTPAFHINLVAKNSSQWAFRKVGVILQDQTVNLTDPDAFDQQRVVSKYTDSAKQCYKEELPYIFRYNNSPYTIAYSAKLDSKISGQRCGDSVSSSGFIRMEAFYYAVEKVANITGLTFNTLFIETCDAEFRLHSIMSDIFREEGKIDLINTDGQGHTLPANTLVTFIGDTSSAASLIIQSYINLYNIPQISHSSSSSWLSDRLRYPTFLNMIPNDDIQAKLMIQLTAELKFERIGLIYTTSAWGKSGAASVEKYAHRTGICISYSYKVAMSANSVKALVKDLIVNIEADMQDGGCRIPRPFIIFAESGILQALLKELSDNGMLWVLRGHFFIGAKNWDKLYEIIHGTEHVALGSLTFGLSEAMFSWNLNGKSDFENYLRQQFPENNDFNPFFTKFWQDYFSCHLKKHFSYQRQECQAGLNLIAPEGMQRTLQSKRFDTEDGVAKRIVMAGMLIAYGYKDASIERCFHKNTTECADIVFSTAEGRNLYFRKIKSAYIPRNLYTTERDLKPIDSYGNGVPSYTVYNIIDQGHTNASFEKVFEIRNGTFQKLRQPIFYKGGSRSFEYKEPLCSVPPQCIMQMISEEESELMELKSGNSSTGILTPSWLLPMLVAIMAVLLLCFFAIIAYVLKNTRRDRG